MQYTQPNLLTALEEGTFSFAYGISPWLFGVFVLLIVAGVWLTYFKTTRPLTPGWKTFFVTTRSGVLVLILFCLLRPVITTMQAAPQETYLGVLIDDSQSMSIADLPGDHRDRQPLVRLSSKMGSSMSYLNSFRFEPFALTVKLNALMEWKALVKRAQLLLSIRRCNMLTIS